MRSLYCLERITKSEVEKCLASNLFISLKDGGVYPLKPPKSTRKNIDSLVRDVANLISSGDLYPSKYFSVFCFNTSSDFLNAISKVVELPRIRDLYKDEIRDKTIKTNLELYGVPNVFQNSELQDKQRTTMKLKYGEENPAKVKSSMDKRCNTMLVRYGVDNIFKDTDYIQRATIDKLGVKNPMLDPNVKIKNQKSRASNDARYSKVLEARVRGIADKDKFSRFIRNEYSVPAALNYLYEFDLKHKGFLTELKVYDFVKSTIPDEEVITNAKRAHGVILNESYYDMDIFIPGRRLGVEINGIVYHSYNKHPFNDPVSKEYHFNKFRAFYTAGVKLISFTDYELYHMWSSVQNIIKFNLGLEELLPSTVSEYAKFLGYDITESLCYGAYREVDLQQVELVPRNFGDYSYADCGRLR